MLSIIYITFRENCQFEWFYDSLMNQSSQDIRQRIQLIVVDGLLDDNSTDIEKRKAYFKEIVGTSIELVHVPPKPTRWQGKYRLTTKNYFAASNTRNTGACYAKYDYIAFVDDLGVLQPTWLTGVLEGHANQHIYCGAYTKVKDIIVENGLFKGGDISGGVDHRLNVYSNTVSECTGGHMYGSSFCMPKSIYFSLNGQNEMCDGSGHEDYELGQRLSRSGYKLYYNKNMFIYESDYQFGSDQSRTCIRSDPFVSETHMNTKLSKYGLTWHGGRTDFSHFMLYYGNQGPLVVNPEFSLEEYNRRIITGEDAETVFRKPSDVDQIHFFTDDDINNF